MTLTIFFALIASIILAVFAIAALLISIKHDSAIETFVNTTAFHCLRCDSIYTSKKGADIENCPNCGYKNPKLKF